MSNVFTRILLRGDTKSNWETHNPVLSNREMGLDMTGMRFKVGNGVNRWTDLVYWGGGSGGMSYKGSWNASTNTPFIQSGTGSQGDYYIVTIPGSVKIDTIDSWGPGDWIIFNGAKWQKIDNSDQVLSVAGRMGNIVLNSGDVANDSGIPGAILTEALNNLNAPMVVASAKILYVDGTRGDLYTQVGTSARPFKSLTAAVAVAAADTTIKIAPGATYAGDILLPNGVCLEGYGGSKTVLTGNIVSGTWPFSLRYLQLMGDLVIQGSCSITDCFCAGSVVVAGAAVVQAINTHLVPASAVPALTMHSSGKFQAFLSTITSTAASVINQTDGQIVLNTCQVTGGSSAALWAPTGGLVTILNTQVLNSGSGAALDLNNSTAVVTSPNLLADALAKQQSAFCAVRCE